MYYSHKYSHKLDQYTADIEKDRAYLQSVDVEEGLLYLLDNSQQFKETMDSLQSWDFNDPRLKTIYFEKYVKDVKGHWQMILKLLNISLSSNSLDKILDNYSFEQLKASSPATAGYSHYRSSDENDYQKNFTGKVTNAFSAKYGRIMEQLGYFN